MSGDGPHLAPAPPHATFPKGRSPMAHLLHALNQPLTGLQCSLELAAAGPRPIEQYVRTLRDGLELTSRMRMLVEALRELADAQPSNTEEIAEFPLDALLRDTADELTPAAESRGLHLRLLTAAPLVVRASRGLLAPLMFRFLESALSLARENCDLQIMALPEGNNACLTVSWAPGLRPEHSPFSRQELGLLVTQAGWERTGGEWEHVTSEKSETYTLRLPLVSPRQNNRDEIGDSK
jgi:C4-dicarboxylate-specific signal transduction histidine kinase